MSTPHAETKKQRREQKIAMKKEVRSKEKKDELKRKKRESREKLSKSEQDAALKAVVENGVGDNHSADNSNLGSILPATRGSGSRDQEIAQHRKEASGKVKGVDISAPDLSSADDIHAVADTLPKRTLNSYQIFIPGKGLTNAPVDSDSGESGESGELKWNQDSQYSSSTEHRYNTGTQDAGPSYDNRNSYNNGQSSVKSHIPSTDWAVNGGLDRFSAFSSNEAHDWQQVHFIEGVNTGTLPGRGGRPAPSSSRLQVTDTSALIFL